MKTRINFPLAVYFNSRSQRKHLFLVIKQEIKMVSWLKFD